MRNLFLIFLFIQPLWAGTSFDLRESGFVSTPKLSMDHSSWAYAATSSLESNILIEGSWDDQTVVKFPEKQMLENNAFSKIYKGGDYKLAAAYLSNNGGVRANSNKSFYFPRSIEWLTHGSFQVNIERIQESIAQNGSVASRSTKFIRPWEYDLDGEVIDFNFRILPPTQFVNIIGWDNERVVPPFQKGVWIVQDSRVRGGVNYFLTPYGGTWVGQDKESGGVSFNQLRTFNFKNIYSYAHHGWQYEFNAEKVSNLYQLKDELPINIGIYTVIPDDSAVAIISDLDGNILCHSKNRSLSNPGFYLLELACGNKDQLTQKVRVELITESGLYALDGHKVYPGPTESDKPVLIKATSSYKESWVFKNGKWIDLKTYYFKEEKQMGLIFNRSGSGNFAINLYTK